MNKSDQLDQLRQRYETASNHSVHMPVNDAISLSRLLARQILGQTEKPDLIVGLANGAVLPTTICGQEMGLPTRIIRVRRQHSRYKQRLLKVKEFLHIPSAWILAGPLRNLWVAFQERFSKMEAADSAFDFDVS